MLESEKSPEVASAYQIKLIELGERPTCVLTHVADSRDDAHGGNEDFIVRPTLLGEQSLEVSMDGGKKGRKVMRIRVVVAVEETQVFDG